MKIFADLHHSDLYYSLQLLFEKRLGAELYRPIGLEWYHQGYWKVFPHINTAKQYLSTEQALDIPKDIHGNSLPPSARVNQSYRFEDGIYYVMDITKDKVQRGITLDKFKDMKFDIVISSIPGHIGPFNELIKKFQPLAKHIFQIGNKWSGPAGVENILASCASFSTNKNIVFYHQEFDLDVYCYEPPTPQKTINSYIHYMKEQHLINELRGQLPGWQVTTYGAGMDASLCESWKIADAIRNSGWTWHCKQGGDGYGHVIHNTYACGRPALIWRSYYQGLLADSLFEDCVTCIDTSIRSISEVARLIRQYSQPEEHMKMCEATHNRFKQVVNFDTEFEEIKKFLKRLR